MAKNRKKNKGRSTQLSKDALVRQQKRREERRAKDQKEKANRAIDVAEEMDEYNKIAKAQQRVFSLNTCTKIAHYPFMYGTDILSHMPNITNLGKNLYSLVEHSDPKDLEQDLNILNNIMEVHYTRRRESAIEFPSFADIQKHFNAYRTAVYIPKPGPTLVKESGEEE